MEVQTASHTASWRAERTYKGSRHVSRNRQRDDRKAASPNQARAVAKMLRISPQKLNLVARLIRGKTAAKALAELEFLQKRIAVDVKKCLESAIANAENNHDLDVDRLFVAEAHVGDGLTMKRLNTHGRGRSGRVEKPFSQLTVVVQEAEEGAAERPKKVSRVSVEPRKEQKISIAEAIEILRSALRARPDFDRTRIELERLSDVVRRPRKDGRAATVALAAARAAVPVLIAGADSERMASLSLLSAALMEISPTQTISDFLMSERVPCVTDVVTSQPELASIGRGKSLTVSAGLSRIVRVADLSSKDGKQLVKLKPWPSTLRFSVRVGAPRARIEPPTQHVVELLASADRSGAIFIVTPTEAGPLPVTVDFLLNGARYARRMLQFTAK